MKKMFLITIAIGILFAGCKKENETDPREIFTGTYVSIGNISIPALDIYNNYSGTETITLSLTDNQRINFGTDGITARVSGNSYIYDKYSTTENLNGYTITTEINGSGTINGNTITESGIITYFVNGQQYAGTWTNTLTK